MAKIQEELILYDRFTNTFTSYIKQASQASGATDRFTKSQTQSTRASNGLSGSLKTLVGGFLTLRGVMGLLNLSDTLISTKSRLDMMNDGLQTTAKLQNMIYQSAQRSRGVYTETAAFVAKLGNLAGDAFANNAEIIAFAEQINKQMALSGTTNTERSAAMLQLTQGLSSGVLRGEELNSVLEQTPMIAKTIADYMGVTTGEMRELASEGKVTAQVVKNAMFAAAEETNKKFDQMPKTWGQRFNQLKNIAIKAFEPLFDALGKLADSETVQQVIDGIAQGLKTVGQMVGVVADNIDILAPAIGGLAIAWGTYKAAVDLATIAQEGFNKAAMANPIGLIITLIVVLVAAIIYLWDKCQGFRDFVLENTKAFAEQLFWFYNDVFVPVANGIIKFINAISEGFMWLIHTLGGNPVAPPPSEAYTAGSFLSTINDGRASGGFVIGEDKEKPFKFKKLDETWLENVNKGADIAKDLTVAELIEKLRGVADETEDVVGPWSGGTANDISNIAKDVGSIENAVNMTQEDIKSLVDIAERRYVNNINLTSQTPVITVNGANTGRTAADRQLLADVIRDILLEQTSAGSIRSTAQPAMG